MLEHPDDELCLLLLAGQSSERLRDLTNASHGALDRRRVGDEGSDTHVHPAAGQVNGRDSSSRASTSGLCTNCHLHDSGGTGQGHPRLHWRIAAAPQIAPSQGPPAWDDIARAPNLAARARLVVRTAHLIVNAASHQSRVPAQITPNWPAGFPAWTTQEKPGHRSSRGDRGPLTH